MPPDPISAGEDAAWTEYLKQFEELIKRPLTAEEVAGRRRSFEWRWANDPMYFFTRKLVSRQGTVMPDFNALYKKKAEIDRKLSG